MNFPGAAFLEYQVRLDEITARLLEGLAKQSSALAILSVIGIVFVVLAIFAFAGKMLPSWSPLICFPPSISVAWNYRRRVPGLRKFQRLRDSYEQGQQRIDNRWQGTGLEGDEWEPSEHMFARDLNLFGSGSFFELLCTTRTQIGARRLAEYLTSMPTVSETKLRQEAAKELRGNVALREKLALLGGYESQQASWETFTDWLGEQNAAFPRTLRWVAAFLAAATLALSLIWLAGLASPGILVTALTSLLLADCALNVRVRKRVDRIISATSLIGAEVGLLREGLGLLREQEFKCEKLRRIQAQVGPDAPARLRSLSRLQHILALRDTDWLYHVSTLLLVGTQTAMAIDSWKAANADSLREWLDAWGEFEALNALACYAYERQETTTFPEFSEGEPSFEATAIGHPLLSSDVCVRNDFSLGPASRFCVISGSNMAGKSTLLRALGTNTVLALAGAPVTAEKLVLSPFNLCASISMGDSLGDGKSKFLSEVERLRDGISATEDTRPLLFLVDEMLSGTNSSDRRIASESIVRALVDGGALGVLSTHDLALTELPGAIGTGAVNMHMSSRKGGGALEFDYLLKPGITLEANAQEIAKMAGVEAAP